MTSERFNHGFSTLLEAIQNIRKEGFVIEFSVNEKGFYAPETGNTYLPESISSVEIIRIDAPFSEPDEQSILYLLTTVDQEKGWISDAYGLYANDYLAKHLGRIKENFETM